MTGVPVGFPLTSQYTVCRGETCKMSLITHINQEYSYLEHPSLDRANLWVENIVQSLSRPGSHLSDTVETNLK